MPQGSWFARLGARGAGTVAAGTTARSGLDALRPAMTTHSMSKPGALRPAIALSLVALLAVACGQQHGSAPSSAYSGYNRPSSYDPPGPPGDPWGPWIREASRRYDVPERWVREVMRQESGGRAGATSPVGAMGLMQVMPGTYRELRAATGWATIPTIPTTASWPARPISARCTTSTARRPSWRPTMPVRGGSRTISGTTAACRTRRATTSRRIGPRIAGTHPQPPRRARGLCRGRDPAGHPARPAPDGCRHDDGAAPAA